jgi:acetyl-CoA synthetase
MANREQALEALLKEDRRFPPPPAFREQANAADPDVYARAAADPEAFWAEWAQQLDWFEPWREVLTWKPPHAKWFAGGKLNASYNCLDRHLSGWRRNKAALVWEGEPGDTRTYTYWDLHREVSKFANVLKSLGVKKGDRVAIYLPMVPDAAIAMLACARIGAPHSVVVGGFSSDSLRDRINDADAKVLGTGDGGFRRGRVVALKEAADRALEETPGMQHVIVVRRGAGLHVPVHMKDGRDHWYEDVMANAPAECEAEHLDAEDLLFILYTSGTTGKPKGVVHSTGGYMTQVHATTKLVFDLKEDDVYWCTADVGWVNHDDQKD